MIYDLRHQTDYRYTQPVTFARCSLRLSPREGASQRVLKHRIALSPKPAKFDERIGAFGETVTSAIIETTHERLTILATTVIEVARPPLPALSDSPPWEAARREARESRSLDPSSPAHFLYPTETTAVRPGITDFVVESFTPDRPVLEAAFDVAQRIRTQFTYDARSTEISTPAIESFRARRGVCQDFAHIMIAGLQGLGMPASYVSGYIRTIPPPGRVRLVGADATHAWVNVWCGSALGWVGFDPTNALVVSDDHIVLAAGRDYADVAPTSGVVHSSGEQTVKVAVDMRPLEDLPLFRRGAPADMTD
jgi:transglutaminase-like putative cysteine protease